MTNRTEVQPVVAGALNGLQDDRPLVEIKINSDRPARFMVPAEDDEWALNPSGFSGGSIP